MDNILFHKRFSSVGFGHFFICSALLFLTDALFSVAIASDVSSVSQSMVNSVSSVPGLISSGGYMMGLILGIMGVLKLRDHVDNPVQTPLKEPMIRFLAGGALFALPAIYAAMGTTIGAGGTFTTGNAGILSIIAGGLGALPLQDFNMLLGNILRSIDGVPGLVSAAAYLLGMIFGVSGVLRIKEHVETPQQTPLREGVIRLLIGGALFALPAIMSAMQGTIDDGAGGGWLFKALVIIGVTTSPESGIGGGLFGLGGAATEGCGATVLSMGLGAFLGGNTLGEMACGAILHTVLFPPFLTAFAYLMGVFLAVWGLLRIQAHVVNPNGVSVWEGVSRLVAGGALFALPTVVDMAFNTAGTGLFGIPVLPHSSSGFTGTASAGGLDELLVNLMTDIMGPMTNLSMWFCYVAGTIFVIIGIMRLIKSAQEGPRGPGGIGTIMTFLIGGALLSMNSMMTVFSMSLGFGLQGDTQAALTYTAGLGDPEVAHVHAVISAALRFMIVIGYISFIRGFFILRAVAEGGQQVSIMAGITHLVGGVMAVNLGGMINVVQNTLGIGGALTFS
jgi:hypothetical protein